MGSPKSGGGRKRRSRGSDAASPLSHGSGGSGPQESEPARKRAKVNTAGMPSGSDEFDEGEIRDSSPDAQLPEADATTTAKPQVSQGGWNRAVGSGLRTSFGAATKLTPRKPQPDVEAASPDAEPTSPDVEPTSPDVEPSLGSEPVPEPEDDEMVVESSGANANPLLQDWVIPQDASFNNYHKKPYAKKGDTWESRLSRWLSVVALANQNNPGLQDPSVFLEVWHQWLNNQRPIDPNLKAIAIKSTTASALGPQKIGKMMEKAKRAIEPPKKAAPSVDLNLVDLSLPPRPPSVAMSLPPSVDLNLPPSVDLNLPPTVAVKDFAITKSDGGLLDNMFAGWLQAVVSLNTDITHYEDVTHYDEKTVDRLLENYRAWVASHVGVSEHKKTIAFKSAKNAIKPRGEKPKKVIVPQPPRLAQPPQLSRARELAAAANGLSEVGAIGHAFIAAHRHPASGNAVVATHGYTSLPDLPVIPPSREPYKALPREEELDCRASYWPFVKPEEVFCLVCTNRGHDSSACPLLICRWCEKKGHRFFVCPDRHRCAKCRQIGHQASCCTEKLVLPLDQMVCASCGDGDHLEDTCPEMFRDTFNPPPERIRKVKHLPIYCGCCGKEGHYWTECAMNEALVTAVHRAEHSTAKTMQYVDPDSENIAICYQNAPRPTSLGFQIRGAATEQQPNSTRKGLKLKLKLQHEELVRQLKIDKIERQRKIEYFADDDDDEPFVRPPVQSKQPAAGRITFSSFSTSNNAGGGNGGGGNRNGGGGGGGGGGRGGRGRGGQRNNDRGGGSMGDRRANPPLPPGPPPPSFGSGQNNHHGGGGGGGGNVRGGRGGAGGSRGRRGGSRGSRGGY